MGRSVTSSSCFGTVGCGRGLKGGGVCGRGGGGCPFIGGKVGRGLNVGSGALTGGLVGGLIGGTFTGGAIVGRGNGVG